MDSFEIPADENTPSVSWIPSDAIYRITGRSFPENSQVFYEPLLDFLEEMNFPKKGVVEFIFQFDYLSSSSLIWLLKLLRAIERKQTKSNPIVIEWLYESDDEDMEKLGLEYDRLISLEINLKVI